MQDEDSMLRLRRKRKHGYRGLPALLKFKAIFDYSRNRLSLEP